MHESLLPKRFVLLPRRLADRVPRVEPEENAGPVTAVQNTWGLSERIAALPGIETTNTALPDGGRTTDHFIEEPYVLATPCAGPRLLCHIDDDGILLPQLPAMDRVEVIQKGWAPHANDSVVLYLPRDAIEMEIVWRIVLLAYRFLTSKPAGNDKRRNSPMLPSYSSAAKYWM